MNTKPLSMGLAIAALVLVGVPACTGSAGGERFTFEAFAAGPARDGDGALRFENDVGFDITLEQARFTLGPVYLNSAVPNSGNQYGAATEGTLGFWRRRLAPLGVRSAHAHAVGDGRVIGEILSQITVDLSSSLPVAFPTLGVAVNERVRTLDVLFSPPPGVPPESQKTPTAVLSVSGVARRDGVDVAFSGELVLDDTWLTNVSPGTPGRQSIADIRSAKGIRADFVPGAGGRLLMRIDPRRLFDGCDFSRLGDNPTAPGDPGRKLLVQSKSGSLGTDQVMRNLYSNLRQSTGTYEVNWTNPE